MKSERINKQKTNSKINKLKRYKRLKKIGKTSFYSNFSLMCMCVYVCGGS